tara:strand:+ start:397 stop:786 length:390 start_codon:yes stop_codon:yes gene_type:complete
MKRALLITALFSMVIHSGEVNSWECNKFDGAKIISQDGEYLGQLGPSWNRDSIFNSGSEYSSTWSSDSIFNDNSKHGNSYSSTSVFNESASNPPQIITDDGDVKYLSIGPSWDSNRLNPYDFKYTCDWD